MDNENLAYWDDKQLNNLGISFNNIDKLMKRGDLIYIPLDDIYVGKKTYKKLYRS
ncbi:MAG: hypothetical protein ACOCRX_10615 [Candidatus Woesearchaeota archaeon]